MIDAAHILVLSPRYVAAAFEFVREVRRALAPTGSGEGDELASHEVAGMRGDDIEEPRLIRGVAEGLDRADVFVGDFHSPCALLYRSISIGEFSPALLLPGGTLTEQAEPSPCLNPLDQCPDTLGALAPCSGVLPSRPARRPSAVHDAWWVSRLNRVRQAGKIR